MFDIKCLRRTLEVYAMNRFRNSDIREKCGYKRSFLERLDQSTHGENGWWKVQQKDTQSRGGRIKGRGRPKGKQTEGIKDIEFPGK